jgi:hypothetical protein
MEIIHGLISCSDIGGNVGWSANRTLQVNITRTAFSSRFYETSTSSFTGSTLAEINLSNVRDGTQNSVAYTISNGLSPTIVSAKSPYVGYNGAVIPSGSPVAFSSSFTTTGTRVYLTWKLYISNSTGDTLICQSGNDGLGGTAVAGTTTATNSTCINKDIYLNPSDRVLLLINAFNDHPNPQSIVHVWDGTTSSYVDVNVTTEGFLTTELVSPIDSISVAQDGTFDATCQVDCSEGFCRNVNVYVQRNTSTSGWVNIGSSGNLVLNTGETNPHNLGTVSGSQNTTFTLKGNIQSSDNNIRCIVIGGYDSYNGTTTASVTVGEADASPPVLTLVAPANLTWFNTTTLNLSYNISDVNDDIVNSTLILNGARNISNQTQIINNQINNFTISLGEGYYTWSVNATDATSLEGSSETRVFYIDTQSPQIELFFPESEMYLISTIDFVFKTNDNMASQMTCNLTVDGIVRHQNFIANNDEIVTKTLSGIGIGTHYWNISCVDYAGNYNVSATRNFSVDDLPPQVFLVTPNNWWFNESNIDLVYNASDNNGFLLSELFLNGMFNQNNQSDIINNEYNTFSLNLADGFYNWTVNVTDTGYYTAIAPVRNFYVDTEKPKIQLISPGDLFVSQSSSQTFIFNVTDNMAPSMTCNLSVGDKIFTNIVANNNTNTNYLATGLTDGVKTWNISCVDSARHYNISENRQITIEEKPKITLNTANNTWFKENILLEYTPSDNTNLSNCSLYINGIFKNISYSPLNNQLSNFFIDDLTNGKYNWNITCFDTYGLSNTSQTRIFYRDNISPEIEIHAPEDDANIFSKNITFNFTATDNMAQNMTCNLSINGSIDQIIAQNASMVSFTKLLSTNYYQWNISCSDNAGNAYTTPSRALTTYSPPEVYLMDPLPDEWLNYTDVIFEYYAYKEEGDIINCSLYINDEYVISNSTPVINDDSNFFSQTLSEGHYTWNVKCVDSVGAVGEDEELNFHIDVQKPHVELTSPSPDEIIDWNNVSFNFTAIDNLAANVFCDLYINDNLYYDNLNVTNSSNYSIAVILNDNTYNWSVDCRDLAYNSNSTETRNFVVDAPPKITLFSPKNHFYNVNDVTFTYLPEDAIGIYNCSLYIDDIFNQSSDIITANQNNTFSATGIPEGKHNWTVECYDVFPDFNRGIAPPNNFTIDKSPPAVILNSPENNSGIYYNSTLNRVYFNWSAIDSLDTLLSCNLSVDGTLRETNYLMSNGSSVRRYVQGLSLGSHYWNVSCSDQMGNKNSSEVRYFNLTYPDFVVNSSSLTFSDENPRENDNVTINSTIYNIGGVDGRNVRLSLYRGHPDTGTQIQNKTANISAYGSYETSFYWTAQMGTSEIYIVVDPPLATNGTYTEHNESNNIFSANITVGSWHFFYGHLISGSQFELADSSSRIIVWNISSFEDGNIYVADSESVITWSNLLALGKDRLSADSLGDFATLDSILEMTSSEDSIYSLYTNSGTPKNKTTYSIFGREVLDVPVAESINNSNFLTGILWDHTRDSNNYFDSSDKEDIVFSTKINKNREGAYGTYDYEIRVPAKLREYISQNSESAVFYLEII